MPMFPPIGFGNFSIRELKEKWDDKKILINEEYQRSEIWKPRQKRELIDSVMKGFSIGVLVLWENKKARLEVLDGQQRVKAIVRYLDDEFENKEGKLFTKLTTTKQAEIEAYSVCYLELKANLDEEQVSDIFTRLQEGTPLNIAEKVNAFRGKFRESFMEAFSRNRILFGRMKNYRFRARFLAAQLLLLELKGNLEAKTFPDLTYSKFKQVNMEYKRKQPKTNLYRIYLNFLGKFLYGEIRAIKFRDWVPLYLLASYLHKEQADKSGLGIYFAKFTRRFMKKLNSFSIYDTKPPKGMDPKDFERYREYKEKGRRATHSDSIKVRFKFILYEYRRLFPEIKYKDKIRLFNEEEKIRIYFKQDCLCAYCGKPLEYGKGQCHHKNEHGKGGRTKIHNGQMLHADCHEEIHKSH